LFGVTGSGSEIKNEGLEEVDGACSSHGKERRQINNYNDYL
jgi:hypothetical protein